MNNTPAHIAIILDGNGRWAKKHFVPTYAGHFAGAQTLKKLLLAADKELYSEGLQYVTAYAFSTENWKRGQEEVGGLIKLFHRFIQEYIDDTDNNIIVKFIGDMSVFDGKLQKKFAELEEVTRKHTGLRVQLALNYGGRDEIRRCVVKIAEEVASGGLSPSDITENIINRRLDTGEIPAPDLMIRTGGDLRVSNFLLWQSAYSELFFDECLWPDYNIDILKNTIESYKAGRERRFGGRKE
ncbi:isoprenyl transferase [Clostridia bacterium]|nr:isoprenyl transferase [Clostridia bacterium]